MSKLIPFLVAGVGASSVSVGGVFMLKNGGGQGGNKSDQQQSQTPTIDKNLSFETLDKFKEGNGGSCVSSYFSGITLSNLTSTGNFAKLDTNSFPKKDDKEVKSCLIVNWKKTEYTSTGDTNPTKWHGNFRLLWSFASENKGFVLFVTTKPFTKDNEIELEGGLYVIHKDTTGKVEKYKELGADVKIDSNSFESNFPKAGAEIKSDQKPYWGFVTGKEDIAKVCKAADSGTSCGSPKPDPKTSQEAGLWKFSAASGAKSVGEGVEGLEAWMKKLFGNDDLGLSTAISQFKGNGTKQ